MKNELKDAIDARLSSMDWHGESRVWRRVRRPAARTVRLRTAVIVCPGGAYAKAKVTITDWVDVLAYSRENGYVEVEFEQNGKWYRVWVPEKVAHIDWGTDNSGNR